MVRKRLFAVARDAGLVCSDVCGMCGVERIGQATDAMMQSVIDRILSGRVHDPMPSGRRWRKGQITPRQQAWINRLIARLDWGNPRCLNRWLGGNWRMTLSGAWRSDQVETSDQAADLIRKLEARCRSFGMAPYVSE